MIIVNIKGGLGNQLFQYSCSKALSIQLGQDLKIQIDKPFFSGSSRPFVLEKIFNVKVKHAELSDIFQVLGLILPSAFRNIVSKNFYKILRPKYFVAEPSFIFWNDINKLKMKNIYLYGYWQSYRYFEPSYKKFSSNFLFNKNFLLKNKNNIYLDSIVSSNSVSIHFRRGDYLKNNKTRNLHGLCSMSYYKKSVSFILKNMKNPHFFIFSDDIQYIKSRLTFIGTQVTFIENQDSSVDFWLMTLCKHNVIANSTFSWWAAWLNKNKSKIVISPKKWFANKKYPTEDLIPQNWHKF